MKTYTTILHPTDFSASAQAAFPMACALARDQEAKLILLHVRPTPVVLVGEFGALPADPRETDQAVLAKLHEMAPQNPRFAVEFLVRDGDVPEEIVNVIAREPTALIVMGTHGRSGLSRLVMGSVAEAILRQAPCSVLTVKQPIVKATAPAAAEPALMPDDLRTICAFTTPLEAEMIRNALKNEGIRSFLEGPIHGGVVGTMGNPVKVQVKIGDFDRASKFVQLHEAHRR